MRYLFYDDETQGSKHRICQVGAILCDQDLRECDTISTLVNPECDFDPYVVNNIHHIDADMCADAPIFPDVFRTAIWPALSSDGVLVAHNARGADLHHIAKSLLAYGIKMPPIRVIDTLDMARSLGGVPLKLAALAERYGVPDPSHHDALNDARILVPVFQGLVMEGAKPKVRVAHFKPNGRHAFIYK